MYSAPEKFLTDNGGDTVQKIKFSIKDFFSKCGFCGFGHIY